ncbi:MAG: amidohydrolase [Deltaproteobacteria bacterium]|nr:amidohydrolase [Deltaproteobacteria bacterium]
MGELKVIDADGHVLEREAGIDWAARLDPAVRDLAPRLTKGVPGMYVEGKRWPIPAGPGVGVPFNADRNYRAGQADPVLRLQDMDLEGIDQAVLFSTIFGLTAINALQNKALAAALARAYNDWLAEYCAADPRRLKGVALVPMQDVPAAVAEARRAVTERGMVALMVSANVGGRNLDHPEFEPLYQVAEEVDVPICVHIGLGCYGSLPAGTERFDNYLFTHLVGHPFEQVIALACLTAGGVLERHPRLRVAFMEAGCSWVPYWLGRLDEHYEVMHTLIPHLPRRPSEYVRRGQCYFSCEPDEEGVPYVLETLGEDVVLYASDYAHFDCKFPKSVQIILERADLSEGTKRKILRENAARLYRL